MNEHDKSVTRQVFLIVMGFMSVVLILLVATIMSLSHLSAQNEHLKLLGQQGTKSELIYTMRQAMRERMLNVSNLASLRTPFAIESEWNTYKKNTTQFLSARDTVINIGVTSAEEETFQALNELLESSQALMGSVIALMLDQHYVEANAKISLLENANENIHAKLTELLQVKQHLNQQAINDANVGYSTTRTRIFLLDVLAIILCLSIITFVVRSISDTQETLTNTLTALESANEHLEERVFERTQDLMGARDAALEANKAKSRFLANMSHELRTPLNAIIGYSDMLIEDAEDLGYKEQLEDLSKIQSAGKHLLSLISDILDISKIEAGKMQVLPEKFVLHDLLQEIINTMKLLMEKRKNAFEFYYDEAVKYMYTDPIRVRQIIFNLLSNATKFTEQGTITLRIEQKLQGEKSWVVFIVKDTGIGISQAQQDKLFQAFVQVDNSATRKYDGTGLGLAISRRFCKLMDGDIVVESKLGNGSQFTVTLPQYMKEDELNVTKKHSISTFNSNTVVAFR